MRCDLSRSVFDCILGNDGAGPRLVELDVGEVGRDVVLRDAETLAASLRDAGIGPGEPVAHVMRHGRAYVAALLATKLADTIAVLVNPSLKPYELTHILKDCGAVAVLAQPELRLASELVGHTVSTGRDLVLTRLRPSTDSIQTPGARLVIYTSGSTGRPKGCVLTEAGISASAWGVVEYLSLADEDSSVVYTPPGYVYALSQTVTHLVAGARMVSYWNGLLHPAHLLSTIAAHRVSGVATNPTGLKLMLRCADSVRRLDHVRYVMTGGQPLTSGLADQVRLLFPEATIVNTYGCTETSSRISCFVCPASAASTQPLPVGYPITGTRLRIVDDHGNEVEDGVEGEVAVRGPTLMAGYWGAEEATRERLRNGWFYTRDRGRYSDQMGLVLSGRSDLAVLVGHEKVGPEEVEAVLEDVPGVSEAAVGSEPDEILEQHLVAVVVCDDPAVTERMCRRRCIELLAVHKCPRRYVFARALPRTLYGKIDRQAISAIVGEGSDG